VTQMASFQDRSFICDDKFTQVIVEMGKRGWRRHQIEDSGRPGGGGAVLPPRDCELIWRNLASTHFQSVFGRCVNHFRGSNHLSNKAFLAYHLAATGRGGLLPSTWYGLIPLCLYQYDLYYCYTVFLPSTPSTPPPPPPPTLLRSVHLMFSSLLVYM
jgi:hypothetical protein